MYVLQACPELDDLMLKLGVAGPPFAEFGSLRQSRTKAWSNCLARKNDSEFWPPGFEEPARLTFCEMLAYRDKLGTDADLYGYQKSEYVREDVAFVAALASASSARAQSGITTFRWWCASCLARRFLYRCCPCQKRLRPRTR